MIPAARLPRPPRCANQKASPVPGAPSLLQLPDLLDPRDERPAVRAALETWLSVQARFAFDPVAASTLLSAGHEPAALDRKSVV